MYVSQYVNEKDNDFQGMSEAKSTSSLCHCQGSLLALAVAGISSAAPQVEPAGPILLQSFLPHEPLELKKYVNEHIRKNAVKKQQDRKLPLQEKQILKHFYKHKSMVLL